MNFNLIAPSRGLILGLYNTITVSECIHHNVELVAEKKL